MMALNKEEGERIAVFVHEVTRGIDKLSTAIPWIHERGDRGTSLFLVTTHRDDMFQFSLLLCVE